MENTCCVTGHRSIPAEKIDYVKQQLYKEVMLAIEAGYTHFISGFTEGADLLFAEIIIEIKKTFTNITLEAAIPYRNRLSTKNILFQRLLAQCDKISIISEAYFPSCFAKRNRHMVGKSTLVISVYDGRSKGGILSNMRYAHAMGRALKIVEL